MFAYMVYILVRLSKSLLFKSDISIYTGICAVNVDLHTFVLNTIIRVMNTVQFVWTRNKKKPVL